MEEVCSIVMKPAQHYGHGDEHRTQLSQARAGVRHVRCVRPNRAADFRGLPILAVLLTYFLHLMNDDVINSSCISRLTNVCTGIRSWPPPISRHPFRCSFGCVLLWNQIYLVHNVPFDNTTPIYLINQG